jgi:hypothetical protein
MPSVTKEIDHPVVLVEGPGWGDAEFYGQWLLSAARAQSLWQEAKRTDAEFRAAIVMLEVCEELHFGITATIFVARFSAAECLSTFVLDPRTVDGSRDLIEFALMVRMGFFELTGTRYQMTIPKTLDLDTVKSAHLELARTEDEEEWLHPEQLVVSMPPEQAENFQQLLRDMDDRQRLADRRALLFLDESLPSTDTDWVSRFLAGHE